MPTYLCHGFRWQRRSIRVYVVVQNLDDASPEWIIPAKSSQCILESFYNIFEFLPYRAPPSRSSGGWSAGPPLSSGSDDDDYSVFNTAAYTNPSNSRSGGRSRSQSAASRSQSQQGGRSRSQSQSRSRSRAHSNTTREDPPPPLPLPLSDAAHHGRGTNHNGREDDISSQDWSVVKLLEEYDPINLDEVSRPYAYVADYVKRIDLSASIFEEIQKYEEQIRADRDPPMSLQGGSGSSDETGRGGGGGGGGGKKPSHSSRKHHQEGGWFEKMRDQLQRGEEIRWYVVVNGDEVRDWPDEPISKQELMSSSSSQRPTPTREQKQHHAQYMLQQSIFSQNDKNSRTRRMELPRLELGGGGGGGGRPAVPEKDLPVPFPGQRLRGPGMGTGGGGHQEQQKQLHQQKSHGKIGGGGFRRLFGKNTSSNNRAEDFYSP